MFKNIILNQFYTYNYNVGFQNDYNSILVHLIQWQYWWWFWFSFLFIFYYLLFLRVFIFRGLKFNPKINTSLKSYGKWGDLIVCLLPISWCLNILINSNFLLRLSEWQYDADLIILRIRGKQWYWVYKLDFNKIFFNSDFNISLGSGWNNIFLFKNKYKFLYLLEDYIISSKKKKTYSFVNFFNVFKSYNSVNENCSLKNKIFFFYNYKFFLKKSHKFFLFKNCDYKNLFLLKFNNKKYLEKTFNPILNFKNNIKAENLVLKLNKDFFFNELFFLEINNYLEKKIIKKNFYFFFNQKRLIGFSNNYKLWKSSFFKFNTKQLNSFFLLNLKEKENFSFIFNTRLLKTNNMLVLPINIPIAIITNSYDVIHSWFVPGLGLKMDCVPGRSTHHTLYIDYPGIYYGQCAEICGRYHHHMPIKICALPFEHFFLWWNHYIKGMWLNNVSSTKKNKIKFLDFYKN